MNYLEVAALIAVTGAAAAQQAPPPPPAGMERVSAEDLSLVLALREDQRAAAAAYVRAWRPPAPIVRPDPREDGRSAPLPEAERREAAERTFVSVLDERQLRVFEAVKRLSPRPPHPAGRPPREPHVRGAEQPVG